jgi:signal transduction histidine kinase
VCIAIVVESDSALAEITVSDDGPGPGAAVTPGAGIGLGNLRERLELMYGPAASLRVNAGPSGKGTTVRITLPRTPASVESAVKASA